MTTDARIVETEPVLPVTREGAEGLQILVTRKIRTGGDTDAADHIELVLRAMGTLDDVRTQTTANGMVVRGWRDAGPGDYEAYRHHTAVQANARERGSTFLRYMRGFFGQ